VASTNAECGKQSNLPNSPSVKRWVPSQIGTQCGADEVERRAICGKLSKSSVERGVIRDRCKCKVLGPATRAATFTMIFRVVLVVLKFAIIYGDVSV